jgi:formylmethanofuran dehydrogenase subunit E-like metal-binding protein
MLYTRGNAYEISEWNTSNNSGRNGASYFVIGCYNPNSSSDGG